MQTFCKGSIPAQPRGYPAPAERLKIAENKLKTLQFTRPGSLSLTAPAPVAAAPDAIHSSLGAAGFQGAVSFWLPPNMSIWEVWQAAANGRVVVVMREDSRDLLTKIVWSAARAGHALQAEISIYYTNRDQLTHYYYFSQYGC